MNATLSSTSGRTDIQTAMMRHLLEKYVWTFDDAEDLKQHHDLIASYVELSLSLDPGRAAGFDKIILQMKLWELLGFHFNVTSQASWLLNNLSDRLTRAQVTCCEQALDRSSKAAFDPADAITAHHMFIHTRVLAQMAHDQMAAINQHFSSSMDMSAISDMLARLEILLSCINPMLTISVQTDSGSSDKLSFNISFEQPHINGEYSISMFCHLYAFLKCLDLLNKDVMRQDMIFVITPYDHKYIYINMGTTGKSQALRRVEKYTASLLNASGKILPRWLHNTSTWKGRSDELILSPYIDLNGDRVTCQNHFTTGEDKAFRAACRS